MPETRKTFNPGRWSGGHQRHPGKMPSIEKCDPCGVATRPPDAVNMALQTSRFLRRPPAGPEIYMHHRTPGCGPASFREPAAARCCGSQAEFAPAPVLAARSSPPPGRPWRTSEEAAAPCAQDAAIVRAFSALVLGRPRHRGRRQQAARSVDGGDGLTGSVLNQQMETFRSVNLSTLGTSRCASWFSKSQRERSTRRAS